MASFQVSAEVAEVKNIQHRLVLMVFFQVNVEDAEVWIMLLQIVLMEFLLIIALIVAQKITVLPIALKESYHQG
jgi:hypothetical protein